jgi:hypothetical protein
MSGQYFQPAPFFGCRKTVQDAMDFAISMNTGSAAVIAASVMYNTMANIANEYIDSIESTKVNEIGVLFSDCKAQLNQANEHKVELTDALDIVRKANFMLTDKACNLEKENGVLIDRLDMAQRMNYKLDEKAERLEKENMIAVGDRVHAMRKNKELEAQIEALQCHITELEAELKS